MLTERNALNSLGKQTRFVLFQDINDCQPNPCENGGTCTDGVNNYTCSCVAGYSGYNCSIGRLTALSISCLLNHSYVLVVET